MRSALLVSVLAAVGAPANSAESTLPVAGEPVEYGRSAFFPERWREQKRDTKLFPWEGRQVVLLTTRKNLDPKVVAVFLDRLDGGWRYYANTVGQSPNPYNLVNGKPTIAAVPDDRLTCGYGCGLVGFTGIEVSAFDEIDYPLVARNAKAFPHYYFYEMGRNYFVFDQQHSSFATGFAVLMRYGAIDALKIEDNEPRVREQIEAAEAIYAKTGISFLQAFTMQGGLDEKAPRLKGVKGPSDQPVMYASAMLKLRKDYGGDDWLKRFYQQLATCPSVAADEPEGALAQSLSWLVAASVAAKQDLTPVFVDRWRFPMGEKTRKALKETNWEKPGLTAADVLKTLPADVSK